MNLTAPWGLHAPARLGWFFLAEGEPCSVEVDDVEIPASIAAGDLIVILQGRGFRLRDKTDSPTTAIERLLESRRSERRPRRLHGEGGASTSLLFGCFLLDDLERSPLYAALPALIHIKGKGRQPLPYVDHLLRLVCQEAVSSEPCAPILINRLARILLIKAVQDCVSHLPQSETAWLRALVDPGVGRALGLVHARPDAPWTVASLAARVAMSRSAFSARFAALVGKPPMEYLTEWRMQKARCLLRTTGEELKEVAAQVGYDSAAAFSKAFTRRVGVTPSAYRKASDATMPWGQTLASP